MVPFVVIIPARLGSTRLPNKPLADIAGAPMVVRVAERAKASGADRVLVATDANAVLEACSAHGFEAVMTRTDHPNGACRLAEAVDQCGFPDDAVIVNVQGDEPLIQSQLIAKVAVHLSENPDCAIATAAHQIDPADIFNPNVVKVVLDKRGLALYFSRAPIPWSRDQYQVHWPTIGDARLVDLDALPAPSIPVYRHIGVYAFRAAYLRQYQSMPEAPIENAEMLEQLRAMWHGEKIAVLITQETQSPGVDTPADLERVRTMFTNVDEKVHN